MYIQDKNTGFWFSGQKGKKITWALEKRQAVDVHDDLQADGILRIISATGVTAEIVVAETSSGYNPHPAPYTVFGREYVDIDEAAVQQLIDVLRITPAVAGAQMPDAQVGYGVSIGGVVKTRGVVLPDVVGFDIGCRMTLSVLDLPVDEFYTDRHNIWSVLQTQSWLGLGNLGNKHEDDPVMSDDLWRVDKTLARCRQNAAGQMGTLGRGNHFAFIGIAMIDGVKRLVLCTHGGSRNTGKEVAAYYTKLAVDLTHQRYTGVPKHIGWLDVDADEGKDYWRAMELMARYAEANHRLAHVRITKELGCAVIGRYTNAHNIATVEDGCVVMRKGAIRTEKGDLAIIPGSSGSPSYLVRGLNDRNNPGSNLNSGPHGAGRVCSTSASKAKFLELHKKDYADEMQKRDIWVSGVDGGETHHAYKDINQVVQAMVDAGAIEVVTKIIPKLVVMGGPETKQDAN